MQNARLRILLHNTVLDQISDRLDTYFYVRHTQTTVVGGGGGGAISGGVGGASVCGMSVDPVCQNAGVTAGGVHESVWVWVWGVVGWVQGS